MYNGESAACWTRCGVCTYDLYDSRYDDYTYVHVTSNRRKLVGFLAMWWWPWFLDQAEEEEDSIWDNWT